MNVLFMHGDIFRWRKGNASMSLVSALGLFCSLFPLTFFISVLRCYSQPTDPLDKPFKVIVGIFEVELDEAFICTPGITYTRHVVLGCDSHKFMSTLVRLKQTQTCTSSQLFKFAANM